MTTTLFRIIKYGFQNFSRNGLVSLATTAVMLLALLVFHGLVVFNAITGAAADSLEDKIDISAYFKDQVAEDEILKIERDLEALAEVKNVEYISKDKALEIFKDRHQNDETISAALSELEANPLFASLNIKAKDPSQYANIVEFFKKSEVEPAIEQVTYGENKLAIDRLASIVVAIKKIGWGSALLLSLVAALVIFNTVRLAIHSNRDELAVMRLVGASNKFINGPYIVAGIIYGAIAGVLSLIIAAPIAAASASYVDAFIPEFGLLQYFYSHLPQFLLYQLIIGAFLGAASAFFAVRKYLKI